MDANDKDVSELSDISLYINEILSELQKILENYYH